MLSIVVPPDAFDEENIPPISPPVRARLEGYRHKRPFCKSPEALRELAHLPHVATSPHAKEVKEKARRHNDEAAKRVARRLAFEEEAKQKILNAQDLAAERALRVKAEKRAKARSHNEQAKEVVARRRSIEADSRERLARRLEAGMEDAEARRAKKRELLLARNAQLRRRISREDTSAPSADTATEAKPKGAEHAEDEVVKDERPHAAPETTAAACAELLGQIRARRPDEGAAVDFEALSEWMRAPSTLTLADTCLAHLCTDGVNQEAREMTSAPNTAVAARLALSLVAMAYDGAHLFDEDEHGDVLMRREATRFTTKLTAALRRAAKGGAASPTFDANLQRARRFHAAWRAADKPKTLDALMGAVVAESARQREAQQNPAPPEELLAQVRRLGGAEAEAEARRRFNGTWQTLRTGAELEQTVRAAAERAFWDALSERVARGEYTALFSVLGELQEAMGALVAHSPNALAELQDKFDAKWLEQRAAHNALELESVLNLCRYVAETIAQWQAPADDAQAALWLATVDETLSAASEEDDLPAFLATKLVPFLRGATARLQQVYSRTVDFFEEREAERRAAEEGNPLAQQD